MRRTYLALGAAALAAALAPPDARAAVFVEKVAGSLNRPTNIVHAGDDTGRTFVSEQPGTIRVYHDWAPPGSDPGSVFLDISALVNPNGEQGLLGLAFHPLYATNGFFYVYYTETDGNHNVVARYHVSADPDAADPLSGMIILSITHNTAGNHNGGRLEFGPDNYLYIGTGDGGSTPNNAQDLTNLLGKILRIDVDSGFPYAIPPTNPFFNQPPKRGEIWAYGVRNPWRFSFDRDTGDLFIGDVGLSTREEVDYQLAGDSGSQNYGWPLMEGTVCKSGSPKCTDGSLTLPILEYPHGTGNCAITGGLRNRSPNLPNWLGQYLYADYCTGDMWAATQGTNGMWTSAVVWDFNTTISTFGLDEAGDVYVAAHFKGEVYRLRGTLPVLSISDAIVTEGNSGTRPAVFQVTLSAADNATISVPYSTMAGSAGPGDFMATSGTLTIPPGMTTASISVPVIGDVMDEPNEAFQLLLGPATGAALSRTQAQGTILDDDGRPALFRPIEALPAVITAQGSYRLTRNLSTSQGSGAAITINSDFVVLDLGGFKIGGGAAGPGTTTVGIYALDRRNVTVRNGNVRGFLKGVFLEGSGSQAYLVERIRADENTLAGIHVMGRGNVVRRNQVAATGGTTVMGPDADTFGIVADGAGARVIDNDVVDTLPVGTGTGYAVFVDNAGGTVLDKNRAGNSTSVSSAGIFAASGAHVLVLGSRLTGLTSGVVFGSATGRYRDNITSGVTTPYTGGTDAGNNQ